MSVMQHPDMPKSMFGIPGMNLWNVLILNTGLAWLVFRRFEGNRWDLPAGMSLWFIIYFGIMLISTFRLWLDRNEIIHLTTIDIISEHFINTYKWFIPAIIVFDSAYTKKRIILTLLAIVAMYLFLAVQVIKWMPLSAVTSGNELSQRAAKLTLNEIGYHRVNLSMMLSGAAWMTLALLHICRNNVQRIGVLVATATIALGQALTGGRTGYITWGLVGLYLCVVRWRKFLPVIPIAAALVITFVPAVRERMLMGFQEKEYSFMEEGTNISTVTSGRNIIWPYVIEQIRKKPLIGYGKLAMQRTGLSYRIFLETGEEDAPHPHNAYLEFTFDTGFIGSIIVVLLFFIMLWQSTRLFREHENGLVTAVGAAGTALVLALLVASMGSQTFYPREGAVGMWAALGLVLRVYSDWNEARTNGDEVRTLYQEKVNEMIVTHTAENKSEG
jgi:O-antigen ligase